MKKLYTILPTILIISAFGPYIFLSLGMRVEHLVIYPTALCLVFLYLVRKNIVIIRSIFTLFFLWALSFAFILITTFFRGNLSFSALADIENFLQPLALMFIFIAALYFYSEKDTIKRLTIACRTLVTLVSLNTVWIVIGFFIDTTTINTFFWGSENSTASLAAQMGRYSGVFNQPAEAGVMYSIALAAWLYLRQKSALKFRNSISLALIVIGGLVTVSKIFVLGGLPLFILASLLGGLSIKKLIKLSIPSIILGYIGYKVLETTWNGQDYLLRFVRIDSQTNILSLFTAGRYGGQSQQSQLFSSVMEEHPILGTGLGVHPVVDSGFFHFFGNGGLIGLSMYLIILIAFFFIGLSRLLRFNLSAEARFLMFLTIIVIGGSFGVPVLVLNRVSIVLWALVCLLLQHFYYKRPAVKRLKPSTDLVA